MSIKSTLTANELRNALDNLASIPLRRELTAEMRPPHLRIDHYVDFFPYRIIYATDGISLDRLGATLLDYYERNQIPPHRLPNLIHVAGKYWLLRNGAAKQRLADGTDVPPFAFVEHEDPTDQAALAFAVTEIQQRLMASRQLMYFYDEILRRIPLPTRDITHKLAAGADLFEVAPVEGVDPIGKCEAEENVLLVYREQDYTFIKRPDKVACFVKSDTLRPIRE